MIHLPPPPLSRRWPAALCLVLVVAAAGVACTKPTAAAPEWTLVWSDDFDGPAGSGLSRTDWAAVQRVVPRVADPDDSGVAPGFLRVVLLPASAEETRDLVPGMRFTGVVDTRTGPANPRFVALR